MALLGCLAGAVALSACFFVADVRHYFVPFGRSHDTTQLACSSKLKQGRGLGDPYTYCCFLSFLGKHILCMPQVVHQAELWQPMVSSTAFRVV